MEAPDTLAYEQALFEQYEEAKWDYIIARNEFGEDDETTQYLRLAAASLYRKYLKYQPGGIVTG